MPDTISSFRQIRLLIQLHQDGSKEADWTICAVTVRQGVPSGSIIASGVLRDFGPSPSMPDVWGALLAIGEAHTTPQTHGMGRRPPRTP